MKSLSQIEGEKEEMLDGAIENMIKFYSGGSLWYLFGDLGWRWRIGERLFCVEKIFC